jgi:lysine biosynthesis protein LysW
VLDVQEHDAVSQNPTRGRVKTRCPACHAAISLKESVELWDPLTCPECSAELEVTSLRPPTLDYLGEWAGDPEVVDEDGWE